MNVVTRTAMAVAIAGLIGAGSAAAQQVPTPPQQEQERARPASPVTGELVAHDVDAKSLTVKIAEGEEMKFSYTDETEIVGAEKGAQGLATLSGATVTVHFSTHGTANTATKIEVQPKQG